MDIAVVGVGVNLTLDAKGMPHRRRGYPGRRGPTVLLVPEAAKAIIGTKLDAKRSTLWLPLLSGRRPIDDKRGTRDFRIKVAGVLARAPPIIAPARRGEIMSAIHVTTKINGDTENTSARRTKPCSTYCAIAGPDRCEGRLQHR